MRSHIEHLKERITELKAIQKTRELDDYEFDCLAEMENELREKEHYQYLSDNDIEY